MTRERISITNELSRAIKNGNLERVLSFLSLDPLLLNSIDRKYRTPLHLSCKYNQMNIAVALINKNCDLNCKNCWGHTPLHTLCYLGNVANCKILIDAGANLALTDNAGYTPLDFALYHKHIDVAILLIESGAPVSVKGPNTGTGSPLHWACRNCEIALMQLLVDRGADATAKNMWRRTPREVCGSKEIKIALDNALRSVDGLANFYSESKAPDDDEIRATFQQMSRTKEKSGPLRLEDDEIYRFLRRNCTDIIPVKRAQELASIAGKMGLFGLSEFGKYIETDRPKSQDHFCLSGCEYISIARALISKDFFSTKGKMFHINDSDIIDVQPMRILNDRSSLIIPGMFSGFYLTENSSNDIIRKKVCIKTEIGNNNNNNQNNNNNHHTIIHERDILMEVKMYEDSHNVAGIVEMLGCGITSDGPYLIVEHFGINLTQFLSNRILPIMERINLYIEICVAVCSLHAVGIMHGAITPDNILISSSNEQILQVKLCNLVCSRKIGEAFPVNSLGNLRSYPGYIAPEVYFGRVGICRATTKIDAFCLSIIGSNLLSRKPSIHKHLLPINYNEEESYDEDMKKYLRDQERINEIILTDLDSPLSDIILSMCQLNPSERCDIETIVNMLQIRNSDIQSDLNSLTTLCDLYDEITIKLFGYILKIKYFLSYDSGGYQLLQTLIDIVQNILSNTGSLLKSTSNEEKVTPSILSTTTTTTTTITSSTMITPPSSPKSPKSKSPKSFSVGTNEFKLSDFNESISKFLLYLEKKEEMFDNIIIQKENLNRIINIINENEQYTSSTSAIKDKLQFFVRTIQPLFNEISSKRTIICLFGDSIRKVLNDPTQQKRKFKLIEQQNLWIDNVQLEQSNEIQSNMLKMKTSLHAVKNINQGLVQFMSNELLNLEKTYSDLIKRCFFIPPYCILLPVLDPIKSLTSPSSFSNYSINESFNIKKNTFRLLFLCSHTNQLIPSNIIESNHEIILTLDQHSKESINPVILLNLLLLRTALLNQSNLQESIIPGLFPLEFDPLHQQQQIQQQNQIQENNITYPIHPLYQIKYIETAYHLLSSNSYYDQIIESNDNNQSNFINLGPISNIPPISSDKLPIITPDIAKYSFQVLLQLIKQTYPGIDLNSGKFGIRLVLSDKNKFGWIIDSDDIETRYIRSGV